MGRNPKGNETLNGLWECSEEAARQANFLSVLVYRVRKLQLFHETMQQKHELDVRRVRFSLAPDRFSATMN